MAKMLEWIEDLESSDQKRVFSHADRRKIIEAIKVTIPDFDPEVGTVQNLVKLRREKNQQRDSQMEHYKSRTIGWYKSQANSARGRKKMFETEIAGLPAGAQQKLREMFNQFDLSIQKADEKATECAQRDFRELYVEAGFKPASKKLKQAI
jgi:hypothetical protein